MERKLKMERIYERDKSNNIINLKKRYGISASDLQREFGFSRMDAELYVEDLNNVSDEHRESICRYVDGMMYYNAYLLKSPQEFADLLNKLFNDFKGIVDKASLAKCVELHPNVITEILKGQRFHKHVDVAKQREILSVFYNSCCDGMGICIPSLMEWREELFDILGFSIPAALICGKYRRQLDALLQDKNTHISAKELAELVKISDREFDEIRYLDIFDDCYEKREAIFWHIRDHYSFETAEKEILSSELVRDNAYFLRYLEYKLQRRTCIYDHEAASIHQFQSLPVPLRVIIAETMPDILSFVKCFYEKRNSFEKYKSLFPLITAHIPERGYMYEELYFYYALIESFGQLEESEQQNIYESIKSRIEISLPSYENNTTSSRSAAIAVCFYFSVLTRNSSLIKKYSDSPVFVKKTKLKIEPDLDLKFKVSEFKYFAPSLRFHAVQWKLWGLLLLSIDSMCDISDIIQRIPKIRNIQHIFYES